MKAGWPSLIAKLVSIAHSYAGQKHPYIALVEIGNQELILPQVRGLYDGLEDAGYVEGEKSDNLIFELQTPISFEFN